MVAEVIRAAVILALLCLMTASVAAVFWKSLTPLGRVVIPVGLVIIAVVLDAALWLAVGAIWPQHADTQYAAPWAPPPSAIHWLNVSAIPPTTPPGKQERAESEAPSAARVRSGHVLVGRQTATSGAEASLLPGLSALASPALPRSVSPSAAARTSGPGAIGTPEPVDPAPSHSLLGYVGTASTYGPLFSEAWVAIPKGPGWRIRVCGSGSCRTLITTDTGPTVAGRVVDLPVRAFRSICGVPWTRGLCPVSVLVLGPAL